MTISERFFSMLEKQGYTQREFCKETGVSQTTVSNWKNRNSNPPAEQIQVIADFLKVSTSLLLTGEEQKLQDLPETELELLDCFRKLDNRGKARVTSTAFAELERIEETLKKNAEPA